MSILEKPRRTHTKKMTTEEPSENIFSYGTLQSEAVQLSIFGRRLEGKPDVLVGYHLTMLKIQPPDFVSLSGAQHHRNIKSSGLASDVIEGTVLKVTRKELEQADAYEAGAGYQRVLVQLKSGANAWVYLHPS